MEQKLAIMDQENVQTKREVLKLAMTQAFPAAAPPEPASMREKTVYPSQTIDLTREEGSNLFQNPTVVHATTHVPQKQKERASSSGEVFRVPSGPVGGDSGAPIFSLNVPPRVDLAEALLFECEAARSEFSVGTSEVPAFREVPRSGTTTFSVDADRTRSVFMVSGEEEGARDASGFKVLSGRESNVLTVPKYSGDVSTFDIFKWRFEIYI